MGARDLKVAQIYRSQLWSAEPTIAVIVGA